SEANPDNLPRSVTVLNRQDIEALPYLSLGNLLEEQAGLYLIGTGQAPGSNQTIFLRGGNTNQTAIFVDGVRIQDVSTVNGVADLTELPLESVDRVEILRGAQGTLYGSPAAAGVILITTNRDAVHHLTGTAGLRSGAYADGGLIGGLSASLQGGTRSGFYFRGDASVFGSKGFNATVDTAGVGGDDDNFTKSTYRFYSGYKDVDDEVDLSFRSTTMATDIDRQAFTDDDNYTLDFKRNQFGLHYGRKFSDRFKMGFSAGATNTNRKAINDSSLTADGTYDRNYTSETYKGEQLSAELLATYSSDRFTLVSGAGLLQERMSQDNFYYSAAFAPFIYEARYNLDTVNPLARTTSWFMHASMNGSVLSNSLSRLQFLGGSRIQHHSLCGTNASFDLSSSFQLDDHMSIYLSYSTGFTTPSLYQLYAPDLYIPWDGSTPSSVTLGYQGLKTENVNSWEVGIRENIAGEWEWRVSIFRNVTHQLIDYVYLWNGEVSETELMGDPNRDDYRGATYANIGNQTSYGMEFDFMRRFGSRWKAELSGCLVDGYLDYDGQDESTGRLAGLHVQLLSNGAFLDAPKRIDALVRRPGNMRAALHFLAGKNITIRWQTRYTGGRSDIYYDDSIRPMGALGSVPLKGYSLTDLSAVWTPSPRFKFQFEIDNLFNTAYQEIQGFASRKRGVLIGLNVHF
ncbi:MAG: TonB-dependent receptor plug domain-containing protein, partial [Bacteroidota bacterium]